MSHVSRLRRARPRQRRPLGWACALVLGGLTALGGPVLAAEAAEGTSTGAASTSGAASSVPGAPKTGFAATLEQCLTSASQEERSATFAGEMTTIPGTARMEMRVDLLEKASDELGYRTVNSPGLGVWHSSAPGVKVYKSLKQVTNLSAPAAYRGEVRFRWLSSKGRLLKSAELRTPRCLQPLNPSPEGDGTSTGATGASGAAGTTSGS